MSIPGAFGAKHSKLPAGYASVFRKLFNAL